MDTPGPGDERGPVPGGDRAPDGILARVQAVAAPIVRALGLELVEVTCTGRGPGMVVRVFIDKPGGIQLGDCEQVHQSLGHALDVEDPIPHSYTLEVSSPGLDRPFRSRRQYEEALEQNVRLKLRRPHSGQWKVIGRLVGLEDADVVIALQEGRKERTIRLAWDDIVEARREIEF